MFRSAYQETNIWVSLHQSCTCGASQNKEKWCHDKTPERSVVIYDIPLILAAVASYFQLWTLPIIPHFFVKNNRKKMKG